MQPGDREPGSVEGLAGSHACQNSKSSPSLREIPARITLSDSL